MNRVLLTSFVILSALLASAEPLVLKDLEGKKHDLFASKDTKAAVIVFVSVDCPIANFYQPTLRKLATRYESQGVSFFQVHADPDLKPADARKHVKDFEIASPVVIDAGQALVRRMKAKVTPEVFVLSPDHITVYRGRIDDTYTTFGKRRPQPTTNDLESALEAILAGQKVKTPVTKPIGCQIFIENE